MFRSQNEKFLISSLGYVEPGSLWIFDTNAELIETVKLSDAKYFRICGGKDDFFSVVHHFDNDYLIVTAHSGSNPSEVVAKISFRDSDISFQGDSDVWRNLQKAYVAYYIHGGVPNFWLFIIEAENHRVTFQQFEWYNDDYDKGYQGITGVTEIPGKDQLLISIQRDSQPVIYDPVERRKIGNIALANGFGNPRLQFRSDLSELWADDYDTLLKLDPKDWKVIAQQKLQETENGVSQFIGEYNFNHDESLCIVPRPFSGDVIGLNSTSMKITHRCELGDEPLEAAVLQDGRVFARNWKDGKLLKGTLNPILKKRWFWRN